MPGTPDGGLHEVVSIRRRAFFCTSGNGKHVLTRSRHKQSLRIMGKVYHVARPRPKSTSQGAIGCRNGTLERNLPEDGKRRKVREQKAYAAGGTPFEDGDKFEFNTFKTARPEGKKNEIEEGQTTVTGDP